GAGSYFTRLAAGVIDLNAGDAHLASIALAVAVGIEVGRTFHAALQTARQAEGADLSRQRRRVLLEVVAHIPERAIVGGVHRRAGIVGPTVAALLNSLAFD